MYPPDIRVWAVFGQFFGQDFVICAFLVLCVGLGTWTRVLDAQKQQRSRAVFANKYYYSIVQDFRLPIRRRQRLKDQLFSQRSMSDQGTLDEQLDAAVHFPLVAENAETSKAQKQVIWNAVSNHELAKLASKYEGYMKTKESMELKWEKILNKAKLY